MSPTESVSIVAMAPEIQAALEAVDTAEVQRLIREVSKHGLAVCLPHMHDEGGAFLPLPHGIVQHESNQKVTFIERDDPACEGAIPVAWRWNEKLQVVASCANCDKFKH